MARITKAQSLVAVSSPIIYSRVFDHNTFEYSVKDGEVRYRLHNTDIAVVESEGVQLFTGGWKTKTSRDRINKILSSLLFGISVYQESGKWYLHCPTTTVEFFEGIKVNRNGQVSESPKSAVREAAQVEIWMKKVNAWAKKIRKDGPMLPNGGDCWCCMFITNRVGGPAPTIEELKKDPDHLIQHLKENYLHGTLLVLAMKVGGYNDNQIGYFFNLALKEDGSEFYRKRIATCLVNMYKQLLGVAR